MITEEKIFPTKALVLYSSQNKEYDHIDYAEITEYKNGEPTISYPAPLEFFKELGKNYIDSQQQSYNYCLFEKQNNIKVIGYKIGSVNDSLVFITNPEKRMLLFDDSKYSGYYHMPKLVWKAQKTGSLTVFALENNDLKINENTPMYMAPFMNLSINGNVCLGSTHWPETFKTKMTELCEVIVKAFFQSKFTHFNATKVTNSNYFNLLENLKSLNHFPNEELVSTDYKLNYLINDLLLQS